MLSLSEDKQYDVIEAFNSAARYLSNLLLGIWKARFVI